MKLKLLTLTLMLWSSTLLAAKVECKWDQQQTHEKYLKILKNEIKEKKAACKKIEDKNLQKNCKRVELKKLKKHLRACKKDYRKNKKKYRSQDFDKDFDKATAAKKSSDAYCVLVDKSTTYKAIPKGKEESFKMSQLKRTVIGYKWCATQGEKVTTAQKNNCNQPNARTWAKAVRKYNQQIAGSKVNKSLYPELKEEFKITDRVYTPASLEHVRNSFNKMIERACDNRNINF